MASDANEGRDTGSEGYRRAERYVIQQFEKLGLKPAGEKGYAQPVALHSVELDASATTVDLIHDGKPERLRFLEEIAITAGVGLPESIEAPIVLADDAGTDVKVCEELHWTGNVDALDPPPSFRVVDDNGRP